MGRIGTRSLLLAIDGVDYTDDVSEAVILTEATGRRRVGTVAGEQVHNLALTFPQDASASSLWDLMWSHQNRPVVFHLAPYGNLGASEAQPHFTGTVTVVHPDGALIGGEAATSRRNVLTVSVVWPGHGVSERLTYGESYPADPPEGWWTA